MTEMAILFDSSRCTGCRGCQVACKCWNDLPSEPTAENPYDSVNWDGKFTHPADLRRLRGREIPEARWLGIWTPCLSALHQRGLRKHVSRRCAV